MNLYRARGDKEMQAANHRNVNTNTNDNTDNDVVEESDLEIISDDEFIYCDQCCKEFTEKCPKCGPLIVIQDNPIPRGTKDRAKKTLPDELKLHPSAIHGVGVFAREKLPARVRFGPYKGVRIALDDERKGSGYAFEVKMPEIEQGGKVSYFIDAQDKTVSNWMRYVNCARYGEEQNVQAFQYRKKIYYRTTKEIDRDEELLVYYGDKYAKDLGLLKADGTPTKGRRPRKHLSLSRSRKKRRDTESSSNSTDTEGSKENMAPQPPEKKKKGEPTKDKTVAETDGQTDDQTQRDKDPVYRRVSLEERDKETLDERWDKWIPRYWECGSNKRSDEMDTSIGESSTPEDDVRRTPTLSSRESQLTDDRRVDHEVNKNCENPPDKPDMECVEKTMVEKQKQQEVDDQKLDSEVEQLRRRLEIQKIQSEQLELELQMKIMEKESNSLNNQKLDIEVKLLRLSVQKSLAMNRIVALKESLERLNLNKTA